MGVSDDLARAMLLKNGWNADLVLRHFAEDCDYIKNTFGFELGAIELPTGENDVLCPVCFCEYPLAECTFLQDCGHGLCTYCYTGYLGSKVTDGIESVLSVCPEQKCNMLVPERLFVELLEPA